MKQGLSFQKRRIEQNLVCTGPDTDTGLEYFYSVSRYCHVHRNAQLQLTLTRLEKVRVEILLHEFKEERERKGTLFKRLVVLHWSTKIKLNTIVENLLWGRKGTLLA